MEIDSMFLLDTNPLLKILILEEQKDIWVNEIFEVREKWGIPHAFPLLLENPCKFYDYLRMLPETFWSILNYIRVHTEFYYRWYSKTIKF